MGRMDWIVALVSGVKIRHKCYLHIARRNLVVRSGASSSSLEGAITSKRLLRVSLTVYPSYSIEPPSGELEGRTSRCFRLPRIYIFFTPPDLQPSCFTTNAQAWVVVVLAKEPRKHTFSIWFYGSKQRLASKLYALSLTLCNLCLHLLLSSSQIVWQ